MYCAVEPKNIHKPPIERIGIFGGGGGGAVFSKTTQFYPLTAVPPITTCKDMISSFTKIIIGIT